MFNKSPIARAVRRALVVSAVAASATLPAYAQESEQLEEIVVTGSRIQRPDLEASSPVAVVSAEDFKMSGSTNAEQFLRDLPQLVPAIGGNTNNGNVGIATLDLRNLQEERTLILVDGKRFMPYDSNGIVDVNMIPAALIERVEIVTGGASAVYGSDAIAGVINFILKNDFEGLDLEANTSQTEEGDGQRNDFSLTVGANFADDRGNMVFNVGYTKADPIYQGDRDFSRFSLAAADFSPGGSATNAEGTFSGENVFHTFDGTNLVDYDASRFAFNFNPFNLLQAPEEKWTATVLGKYEINDNAEFFSRFSFANTQVKTIIAPSGTFFFPFTVNYATNPFLTDQARSVLALDDADGDGFVDISFGRRTVELGTRDSIYENTAYQGVVGVRGDFGQSWSYEVFAQQGRTVRTQNFLNDINAARVQQGMLAIRDTNGNIVCIDDSNSCVPVNLFGVGTLTPEMADYIRLNLSQSDTTEQFVGGGFVTGDLPFQSPLAATAPAIVIGLEYRGEEGEAKPDDATKAGLGPGFGQSMPLEAKLNVREAYSELKFPLVTDRPFVQSLGLEAGVRRSDYSNRVPDLNASNDFSTTAWKAGGDWAPVQDVRFRALYQRAVRAPNLNEIGDPRTNGTGDAGTDYCSRASFTAAMVNDPAFASLRALCLATGVSATQLGSVPNPISGQVTNYSGGNPSLVPEESDTITVGMVLQPSFLRGFTASIDYFDIKVEKAILDTPEQAILDACYSPDQNPGLSAANPFCALIHRNPLNGSLTGGLETGVDASARNIGFLRARGVDLTAGYGFDMGRFGNLALNVNLTKQLKVDLRFTDSGPVYECVGLVGEICLRPTPELQWIQATTWSFGPASVQLRWRHIGSLTKDSVARGEDLASDFMVPKIDSFDYFDLSGAYDLTDSITLRAGIQNLFGKEPPVVGNDYGGTTENSGNTFPATYETLGRSFFLSATAHFGGN
jgi:iron complex outermembrane recepter protein